MRTSMVVLVSILAFPVHAAAAQDSASVNRPAHRIIMTLSMDTNYNDSPESLARVKEFLKLGLFEPLDAAGADDDAVFARYWFGPSKLPKTFALIREAIVNANKDRPKGSPLLIPALPRLAANPDPQNHYRQLPRVATYRATGMLPSGLLLEQQGQTAELDRRSSTLTLLQIEMPSTAFGQLRSRFPDPAISQLLRSIDETSLATSPEVFTQPRIETPPPRTEPQTSPPQQVQAPFGLGLVAGSASVSGGSTARSEAASFRPIMALSTVAPTLIPHRPAYLLVLDEGWPDALAAEQSIALVEAFINKRRAKHGLKTKVSIPRPSAIPATHASVIAAGLAAYVHSNPSLVHVYYLPVLMRDNTRDYIAAILHEYELEVYLGSGNAYDTARQSVDADAETRAQEYAKGWEADAAEDKKRNVESWRIRSPVLNFMYSLGDDLVASSTGFIASHSWTVPEQLFSVPHSQWDITVCAAGNNGDDLDNPTVTLDYASRSVADDEFLTVMAGDKDGNVQCGSNTWSVSFLDNTNVSAVLFDSTLANGCGGTSVSAPRVAWWLAAAIANRVGPVKRNWRTSLVQLVCPTKPRAFKDLYFDPSAALGWN